MSSWLSAISPGVLHPAAGKVHSEAAAERCRGSRRGQCAVCWRTQSCGPQGTEESACSWRVSYTKRTAAINNNITTLLHWIILRKNNTSTCSRYYSAPSRSSELKKSLSDEAWLFCLCSLDLDAWINEPPSESESEDEQPKAIFAKEEPKHSRPRHAEVDEKELARVCVLKIDGSSAGLFHE